MIGSQVTLRLDKYLSSTFYLYMMFVSLFFRLSFIYFFYSSIEFFSCELEKEDKGHFYFNFVASLLLNNKFMKDGCSSSLSLKNYWMVPLQFGIITFLLLFLLFIFWLFFGFIDMIETQVTFTSTK